MCFPEGRGASRPLDGLEATRRIKQLAPATKVVVLSALPDEPYRRMAHDSGADVFLNKRDTATALLPAIWGLTEGAEASA
jgi:DNA-binding NarL/FixJ family response regulator